jgi:general secretion pathway protein G
MVVVPYTPLGSGAREHNAAHASGGFTLIELLVVLAIIATLVTLALPRYFHSVERGKETVLLSDLSTLRDALDHFNADLGHYPGTLEELVERGYIRKVPPDPMTDSPTTWILVTHPDGVTPGIYDVHSGAEGKTLDGIEYQLL